MYLKFIPGQPHKGLFVVTLSLTACSVALYLRVWGRSTSSTEFVMRLLKRDPHGPAAFFRSIKPRLCSNLLLRLENPCCNACFPILLLDIFMNMPASQNRSNCAFRYGFLRLDTDSTPQSGLKFYLLFFLTFINPECLNH